MIALVRVDNRLVHGQVVQTWVPQYDIDKLLVVDDASAESPLTRAAMEMAVLPPTLVEVVSHAEVDFAKAAAAEEKVLVLVREVADAARAYAEGLPSETLNLGNVHFTEGRRQVSPSVYLSPDELAQLKALAAKGAKVDARALPKDKPLTLPDIEQRFA